MANYWTLEEIRDKVERDLDLEDETFITETELNGYIQEGVDSAEAEILRLYEDYFSSIANLSLVSGTNTVNLPTDVYAMKIRSIQYRNGSTTYPITRIRDSKKFLEYAAEIASPNVSGAEYRYFIDNSTTGTPKILLLPTPAESGAYLYVGYIRNANELEEDADVCDIPEFVSYVIQFAKVRCYEKEGHPNLGSSMGALDLLRKQMIETLENKTPDNDNLIEADMSHYQEHN